MTEVEWLSCSEPMPMLEYLRISSLATDRKLRLFAVACSRRIEPWLDDLSRRAMLVAERYADGLASAEDLRAARLACATAGSNASWYSAVSNAAIAARNAALSAQAGFDSAIEQAAQADLLRDLFDNPFRPLPPVDPAWRSAAVLDMARTVYLNRDFQLMQALADLLAAAGCDDKAILDHCRSGRMHARGCWLVDRLLGQAGISHV